MNGGRVKEFESVRDFQTDISSRYPRDIVHSSGDLEGRTYEDLQIPQKLRTRELLRIKDRDEDANIELESFLRNRLTVSFETKHNNEDLEIPHRLGVVPTDVIIGLPDDDAKLWRGDTEWTTVNIYMRSQKACNVRLYVVV